MIKSLISGSPKTPSQLKEQRISAKRHGIHPKIMSPVALNVVDKLLDAGHEAYLVGGCIRDALLGKEPKDFDVATSATPEEVKRLFRRSRIIGRRFRIVHVQEGREIIEVTTFRGSHKQSDNIHASQNQQGVLVRDNVYGDLDEDALRRDFTCNSLYYDIDSHEIVDFMGGQKDLKKRVLRTIGDPSERFVEDPVRMMRAIRFEAKLGLKLDSKSKRELIKQIPMIREVSAARMFDEVVKLLLHEEAIKAYKLMTETGLFMQLFPWSAKLMQSNQNYKNLVDIAIRSTEVRMRDNQRASPFYLYAVFLWPAVEQEYIAQLAKKNPPSRAMDIAGAKIIDMHAPFVSIAKRFSMSMKDTWYLQTQFDRRDGKRASKLYEHPRFRAAYDFLKMREESGEDLNDLGDWWTKYQAVSSDERAAMVSKLKPSQSSRKPRSKSRRNKKTS